MKIADMYCRGADGLPKDDVMAYMWFNVCVSNTWEEDPSDYARNRCAEERDDIEKKMSRSEIAEAQRLSREKRDAILATNK